MFDEEIINLQEEIDTIYEAYGDEPAMPDFVFKTLNYLRRRLEFLQSQGEI